MAASNGWDHIYFCLHLLGEPHCPDIPNKSPDLITELVTVVIEMVDRLKQTSANYYT